VGWVPEPRWDLRVALADLDPGRQWADWPGKLGGGLQTRGFVEGAGPRAKIDLTAIEGILRGYPFRLTAGAETEGREATLDRLVLTSGEARVSASGKVGEALALEWKVSAPSIEQLIPGAAGSLSGEGRVAGTVGRPRLVARLQGSGLALNENRLGRLEADVDLGLARDDAFRLTLDALGLAPGGKRVGDLAVRGTGSPSEHRVTLDLTGGDLGLGAAVALAGGLREDGAWAGRLERADLGAGRWGDWRLASPAALALGRTVRAEPLCWASGEARVCAAGSTGEGRSWKGELTVSALPLGLLQSLLPKELEVAGALEARVTASGTANGGLRAQASLSLPGAALTVPMGEERRRLDLSRGTLQARVDDRGISVSTALYLGDLADLDAGLDLPGWTPAVAVLDRQRVTARLKARVPDLAWVRAFAPALGAVGGQVAVDLSVGGTLGAPRLSGQAALSDARAEVPDAGLALEGLRLSARAEGASRLVYEGGVRSGEGDLALAGETLLDPAKGFPTRLEVKGKEFVAVNTSEFWALVSPDLRLDRDAAGARVEGEVFVPRARIRPRGVPKGAVAPSRDVVVRGEGEEGRGAGVPVAASVRLRLGDQVSFDGIGLRGRFEGDLLVVQTPPRDPIGNGKIGIVSGVYSGLGTDLEVERGSVNYASSPLDNPGLDVKAVKRTQEVVAGVRVTGTAQDPKVQVFSEPPRPQSEVLSYLLFGRPMGGGSGTDKAQLQNAAALAGGGLLAAEVGRQLGLEEFRLGGAEGGGAALTVGQYVTPQIYLQYVTGIRSALNRLRIRYDITKRIQLQTETGDQQAADVFYIFER
jgi:translocation and assembly module TamB